jgi:hypothetical protein
VATYFVGSVNGMGWSAVTIGQQNWGQKGQANVEEEKGIKDCQPMGGQPQNPSVRPQNDASFGVACRLALAWLVHQSK